MSLSSLRCPCAVEEENVYTFGRGQYGQLGHGTFLFQVDLPKPLETFGNCSIRHIACGENHTAVITGNPVIWNVYSLLCDGRVVISPSLQTLSPTHVFLPPQTAGCCSRLAMAAMEN